MLCLPIFIEVLRGAASPRPEVFGPECILECLSRVVDIKFCLVTSFEFDIATRLKTRYTARPQVFPGSSAVEQPAVNRLVGGSNPSRGAT